jgi:putative ubiquitin-RnfH superfamily antitoxin RatB of RatAB toxin-antitoxin module
MATIRVVVACSPQPREVDLTELELPLGATVGDALAASGLATRHPALDLSASKLGVWGKVTTRDAPLRDGDRVEVYRGLKVDPKEARRQRYRSHREKTKPRA